MRLAGTHTIVEVNYYRDIRRHPRYILELPVEYRMVNTLEVHAGMVINVSQSGLLIHSGRDLPAGTSMNVAVMFFKGFELTNIDAIAEIVWKSICCEEKWKGFEYGLEIIQMKEEELLKLKELLKGQFQY